MVGKREIRPLENKIPDIGFVRKLDPGSREGNPCAIFSKGTGINKPTEKIGYPSLVPELEIW
jgi:hypothetical protein